MNPSSSNSRIATVFLDELETPPLNLRQLAWRRFRRHKLAIFGGIVLVLLFLYSFGSVLILPEYWQSGVAVLLFDEMRRRARARGYTWADLSLTSLDNPYTPALATRMGGTLYKRYRVYQRSVPEAG